MRDSEFWMREDIGFQMAWSNSGADELCNATRIICWTFVRRTACSAVCRHAVVKYSSVVEAAAAEGSKQLFSSSGNTNGSQKYVGEGKVVHGPSCSGEDYKSSLSAGGCLEIHNLMLLAGCSALSLQVHKTLWNSLSFAAICQTLLWHGVHYSRGWSSTRSLQMCVILCAFPNTACFLLPKPCIAIKGNLYKQS